jgi:hypothetical protein
LKWAAQGYIGPSMEVVPWNNLRIGKKYFVVTTPYPEYKKSFIVKSINFMNQGEAMIYDSNGVNAYAAGGIFDEPGGPMNVFWTDPEEDYSTPDLMPAAAAAPASQPAAPPSAKPASPPPPLNLSGIQMSDDEWAMAYGLRRCRLCGYNEGPEICPNNCYAKAEAQAEAQE